MQNTQLSPGGATEIPEDIVIPLNLFRIDPDGKQEKAYVHNPRSTGSEGGYGPHDR